MDNWLIFIIIAIGIISSFLNKQTKTVSQTPKEHKNYESPVQSYEPPVKNYESPKKNYEYKQGKKISDEINSYTKRKADKIERDSKIYNNDVADNDLTESNNDTVDYEFNYNNVFQGMIWSEVLGPPRSKKAHYSFISKNK